MLASQSRTNHIIHGHHPGRALGIVKEPDAVFANGHALAHGGVHPSSEGVAERCALVQLPGPEGDGVGACAAQVIRASGGAVGEGDGPGV